MINTGRRDRFLDSIIGISELAPLRSSSNKTTLGPITPTARLDVLDTGLRPDAIDGLMVAQQMGVTPMHVSATVAGNLGLPPQMANVTTTMEEIS